MALCDGLKEGGRTLDLLGGFVARVHDGALPGDVEVSLDRHVGRGDGEGSDGCDGFCGR